MLPAADGVLRRSDLSGGLGDGPSASEAQRTQQIASMRLENIGGGRVGSLLLHQSRGTRRFQQLQGTGLFCRCGPQCGQDGLKLGQAWKCVPLFPTNKRIARDSCRRGSVAQRKSPRLSQRPQKTAKCVRRHFTLPWYSPHGGFSATSVIPTKK